MDDIMGIMAIVCFVFLLLVPEKGKHHDRRPLMKTGDRPM